MFLVFVLVNCKQENTKKTIEPKDTETFELIGNVKSVQEEISISTDSLNNLIQKYIEYVFDENQKIMYQKTFNASRELVEEIQYNGLSQMILKKQFISNELVYSRHFQWNSRKQLVSEIKKNKMDSITEKTEFEYELGFLKTETYQNFGTKNNTITRFERNEKGLVLEEIFESPKGVVKSIKKFVYDEKQNKISETQLNSDNQIIYSLFITYNEENLPVLEKYYDANGQVIQQYAKEYDVHQNVIKSTSIQTNVEAVVENYIYDSNKKLLEFESIVNNEKIQTTTFNYDEKGNQIAIQEKNLQGTYITQFQYEYDAKGNWTFKKEIQSNGTVLEFKRTINYF